MSSDTLASAKEAFGEGETLTFEEIQAELVQLKPELDKYTQVKKRYDSLREAAMFEMMANGIKSTLPKNGFSLVLSERVTPQIVDEEAAKGWIFLNLEDADNYLKVDGPRYIELASRQLEETGEVLPGIESSITQYVSVKRAK